MTFTVKDLENRTQRIDTAYFSPAYHQTMEEIRRIGKAKEMEVEDLDYFLRKTSPTHLTGGATPKGAPYVHEGIRFLRVQNVRENELVLGKCVRIVPETHENELKRSQLRPDNILLTITGVTYGLAAIVPKDIGEANINQHIVKMEVERSRIDPQYLAYYLNSSVCRSQMDRAVTGSSRPALDYRAIRSFKVACPADLAKQSKIAEQIAALRTEAREKLDEARKLAASQTGYILTELGLTLPNTPAVDTFTVSPKSLLGRIDAIAHDPQYGRLLDTLRSGKFEPKSLTEFAGLGHESVTPSEEAPLNMFRLVELDDVDGELGVIARVREYHGIEVNGSKLRFRAGQILVSRLRFYLRKAAIVDSSLTNGIGSGEFYTLDCKKGVDAVFLKTVLRHPLLVLQSDAKATGSSRPRLTRRDIESLRVPDVPSPIQRKIGHKVSRDLERIKELRREASTLSLQAKRTLDDFLKGKAS